MLQLNLFLRMFLPHLWMNANQFGLYSIYYINRKLNDNLDYEHLDSDLLFVHSPQLHPMVLVQLRGQVSKRPEHQQLYSSTGSSTCSGSGAQGF